MRNPDSLSPQTRLARGLGAHDPATGGVMPAIHPATTFVRDADYALVNPEHSYARADNPTFRIAERMLADLEGAADARLFASGMAAASTVFQVLRHGDHVVLPREMYFTLRGWVLDFGERFGIAVSLVPAGDMDALAAAVEPGRTRLVWVETPSNPTFRVTRIAVAAEIAHSAGARLVVDGTVATPFHTRALDEGADLVMHSTTKALNGHSDVLGGALATRANDEFWASILRERETAGAVPGPFDAWLLQRGLRTLFVRMATASANAMALAEFLDGDPRVSAVHYPGLPSHDGHDDAAAQMQRGFGSLLAFEVPGGADAALAVAGRCAVLTRATSLGGVESLLEHRASIEGPDSPVPAGLLRVSVGIEAVADLMADLDAALGEGGAS